MPRAAEQNLALDALAERARREDGAGCECSPEAGAHRLRIWGWFPPDWCGNLSLHCYAARVSILEGEARRVRAAHWVGSFRLVPAGPSVPPQGLDFVSMARHRPTAVAPAPMQIDRLAIEPERDDGSARVHVAGPDRIGFLAWVLDRLAFCGLYPHQLSVRTRAGGRAEDCFDVQGVGGTPPLPRALAALEALLLPRAPGSGA